MTENTNDLAAEEYRNRVRALLGLRAGEIITATEDPTRGRPLVSADLAGGDMTTARIFDPKDGSLFAIIGNPLPMPDYPLGGHFNGYELAKPPEFIKTVTPPDLAVASPIPKLEIHPVAKMELSSWLRSMTGSGRFRVPRKVRKKLQRVVAPRYRWNDNRRTLWRDQQLFKSVNRKHKNLLCSGSHL